MNRRLSKLNRCIIPMLTRANRYKNETSLLFNFIVLSYIYISNNHVHFHSSYYSLTPSFVLTVAND